MFKILIAEDDNELCQLFKKVLNKHGYQVLCAADGKEALDLVEKEYIDLIITDIMVIRLFLSFVRREYRRRC